MGIVTCEQMPSRHSLFSAFVGTSSRASLIGLFLRVVFAPLFGDCGRPLGGPGQICRLLVFLKILTRSALGVSTTEGILCFLAQHLVLTHIVHEYAMNVH